MEAGRRSAARAAVAVCLAALVGVLLVAVMMGRDLDGGLGGAVLWVLIAVVTAAVFTMVLDGPSSLIRLVRGDRQR